MPFHLDVMDSNRLDQDPDEEAWAAFMNKPGATPFLPGIEEPLEKPETEGPEKGPREVAPQKAA